MKLGQGERVIKEWGEHGIVVTNKRVTRTRETKTTVNRKLVGRVGTSLISKGGKRIAEGTEYYDFPIDKISGVYHMEEHRRRKGLLYGGIAAIVIGVMVGLMGMMGGIMGAIPGLVIGALGIVLVVLYNVLEAKYIYVEELIVASGGSSFSINVVDTKKPEGGQMELEPIAFELCAIVAESK